MVAYKLFWNVKIYSLLQISGLERRNVSLADLVKSLKEDLKQMEQRLETATAEFEHYKVGGQSYFLWKFFGSSFRW